MPLSMSHHLWISIFKVISEENIYDIISIAVWIFHLEVTAKKADTDLEYRHCYNQVWFVCLFVCCSTSLSNSFQSSGDVTKFRLLLANHCYIAHWRLFCVRHSPRHETYVSEDTWRKVCCLVELLLSVATGIQMSDLS